MKLNELLEHKQNLLGLKINDQIINQNEKFVGYFNCVKKQLTSLEGCPTQIDGDFSCLDNKLTSLEYGPLEIDGFYWCSHNKLTQIDGPTININGYFRCDFNKIQSLHNIHKQILKMKGGFYATKNPIKSHVLGLLKIPGLTKVELDNKQVQNILNKYIKNKESKSLINCQNELIDLDLDEYAQL